MQQDIETIKVLMQSQNPHEREQALVWSQLLEAQGSLILGTALNEHQNATSSMLGQLAKAVKQHEKTATSSLGALTQALKQADSGARKAAKASSRLTIWLIVASIVTAISAIAQAAAAILPSFHK